jgi:transcriptional regulator with XRE-family HTH domain
MRAGRRGTGQPGPKRKRQERLAEKLLEIRLKLGLSQGDMMRRLGEDEAKRDYISKYERGVMEPPLAVLLEYSRMISTTGGGEFLEALIDDSLDLPTDIPANPSKHPVRSNKKKA